MQLKRLFISPPGGGAWVAYLIVGDAHINLHDLAAQHEDVKNVLQTSRLRFLTAPEFRLLFDKGLVGLLLISPSTPGINREGLYFIISHSDKNGTHYKPVKKDRNIESRRLLIILIEFCYVIKF